MAKPPTSFAVRSICNMVEYLAKDGWSVGESVHQGKCIAVAHKMGLAISGTGANEYEAWQDLLRRMHLAGRFGWN